MSDSLTIFGQETPFSKWDIPKNVLFNKKKDMCRIQVSCVTGEEKTEAHAVGIGLFCTVCVVIMSMGVSHILFNFDVIDKSTAEYIIFVTVDIMSLVFLLLVSMNGNGEKVTVYKKDNLCRFDLYRDKVIVNGSYKINKYLKTDVWHSGVYILIMQLNTKLKIEILNNETKQFMAKLLNWYIQSWEHEDCKKK